MSVSNVEVGKKVKEMRLHNNMSQQEFSERTHIMLWSSFFVTL